MVQQQAAILSFIDMFAFLGVVFLLMTPLILLMRRPTPPNIRPLRWTGAGACPGGSPTIPYLPDRNRSRGRRIPGAFRPRQLAGALLSVRTIGVGCRFSVQQGS
jgi:hypothetical protein